MAKTKEFRLPRYLKLNKGMMWMDIDGRNSSSVRLYATDEKFIGRGYYTDDEWDNARIPDFPQMLPEKPIPEDQHKNKNSMLGEFGYIKQEKDRSWFDTSIIPKDKLSRIIEAYKHDILVTYNPKKHTTNDQTVGKHGRKNANFKYNKDGDLVFVGKKKDIYNKLQNYTMDQLKLFIHTCEKSSFDNLVTMYHYELDGHNKLQGPRFDLLQLILDKINTLKVGPYLSPISVNEDKD